MSNVEKPVWSQSIRMGQLEMEQQEEYMYTLMMDALDGELAEAGQSELDVYLRAHPSLMREWQAMQTIDTLFRQTPALEPVAGFVQRTINMLPNHQARQRVIGVIYLMLLLSGILPLLLGVWVVNRVGGVLADPAMLGSTGQVIVYGLQVAGALFRALFSGAGELLVQQPAVWGWLLVMGGVVFLWSGVYRQLLNQPRQISNGS